MKIAKICSSKLSVCLLAAIVCLLGCSRPALAQAKPLTDADIDKAILAIKKYFYDTQDKATGGWYGAHHASANAQPTRNDWGPTSMAALALIVSGESPQKPELAKALKLLSEKEITGVYALSMRMHLWSYLPQKEFGPALAKDFNVMSRSSYGLSRFDYIVYGAPGFKEDNQRIDNSTTQYGILAMWQASKRGFTVDPGFWRDIRESLLSMQSESGGWAYSGNRNVSETMTCAGLTCMFVAQQELYRGQDKPDADTQKSINAGLKWLDENFGKGGGGHGGGYMYYGYERVALASGRKYFGGKDWFQDIAHKIVQRGGNYGNAVHEAAFNLMFLARGRVPVWINKLEVPGANWNNRPNDIYFLNRYISEFREHEVNWQIVNTQTEPEEWISAPLMWISSDDDIEWTDDQVAKIKQYIDLGGTVICNPESGSRSFRNSVEDLAARMYPNLKFSDVERDDPLASLLVGSPRGNKAPDFRVLSNGARVLMILPQKDWGMTFQADKAPDAAKKEEWRHITNIYGVVTDRGELTPRLSSPIVQRESRPKTGTIKVVIPQWQDPAGAMPENDVYYVMRNYLFNQTGKELLVEQLPLSELATADPSLLHLVGVNAIKIEDDERQAIQAYLAKGGTILVENLGGKGSFVKSVRDQLSVVFPGDEDKVGSRSSIITGLKLPEGSQNNRRLVYRRMVLERSNPEARLLLRGFTKNDRYPVLLSYEDLSLGMLGVKQYGINGYGVETSRNLMVNILLEANQAYPGSTTPHTGPAPDAAANAQ